MKKIICISLILILLIACKEKKPIVIDSECEKVRFPDMLEGLDSNVFTSKSIELTKDSTYIGMWYRKGKSKGQIISFYTKKNKLFEMYCSFYLFESKEKVCKLSYIKEKKILVKDTIDYIVDLNMDSVEESLKSGLTYYISANGNHLYSVKYWRQFRKIDSLTQPFAERELFLDYCENVDTNTIAWFSGGLILRWYKKDGVDYIMWISDRGYECQPVEVKKRRKGYELTSLRGLMFNNWISLDTTVFFTPTENFKDTTTSARRLSPERVKSLYDSKFMYHLVEYDGAYLPD